jgi:hypothetical protein
MKLGIISGPPTFAPPISFAGVLRFLPDRSLGFAANRASAAMARW